MRIIHKANWDYLSNEEIVLLFDKMLPDVAIQPNIDVVVRLRKLGVATLELFEDRSSSTVYRIRQTGEVIQIEANMGESFIYDDAAEYAAEEPFDTLVESFAADDPKYTISECEAGAIIVTRHKRPRFTVKYLPTEPLDNIEVIEWMDPVDPFRVPKLMQNVGRVIDRYLKNK